MADPLVLLREYNISKKEIIREEGQIIFGDFSWPENAKTNYLIQGSGKDGTPKDYYTLECLLFFLEKAPFVHPAYVRHAAAENIPAVRRPDRKDLLSYLNGETTTSSSIDKSAPIQIPTQVKRQVETDTVETLAKKPRHEKLEVNRVQEQLVAHPSHMGDTRMAIPLEAKDNSKLLDVMNVVEFGISLSVNKDSLSPKRNEGFYSREMDVNRALVTTALSSYCASGQSVFTPVKCIDVIGSTGVAGLLWKKYLGDLVDVNINDPHERSHQIITENSQQNHLYVNVIQKDPRVLLQEVPFSFIHLDCHTDAAIYLDSVMRNVPKQGLLAVTTKDDGALYGRTPEMALRNYGGTITRTFYAKELAARLIIAGMARSAAIHNKGLEVLCVLSVKSTITIIAKALKGPAQANAAVGKIRRLVHCNMCEDRAFYPSSMYPLENPGKLLSCQCPEQTPGKVVVELGPVWTGCLFNFNFLLCMNHHLDKFPWKKNLKELMDTLLVEAWCPKVEDGKVLQSVVKTECHDNKEKRDQLQPQDDVQDPPCKKLKEDQSWKEIATPYKFEPPFYFNLHKHSPKGPNMIGTGKIVASLQKSGYRASRTHFDPLAVRTNASLAELKSVIAHILS